MPTTPNNPPMTPYETPFRVFVRKGIHAGTIGTAVARRVCPNTGAPGHPPAWEVTVVLVVVSDVGGLRVFPVADEVAALCRDGCYELWLDARPSLDHPLDDGGAV